MMLLPAYPKKQTACNLSFSCLKAVADGSKKKRTQQLDMRVVSVEPVVCRWPPVLRIHAAHLSRSPFCFAPQILEQKREFSQWVIFRRKTGSLLTLMIRVCYVAVATGSYFNFSFSSWKGPKTFQKKESFLWVLRFSPLLRKHNFQTLIQLGLW